MDPSVKDYCDYDSPAVEATTLPSSKSSSDISFHFVNKDEQSSEVELLLEQARLEIKAAEAMKKAAEAKRRAAAILRRKSGVEGCAAPVLQSDVNIHVHPRLPVVGFKHTIQLRDTSINHVSELGTQSKEFRESETHSSHECEKLVDIGEKPLKIIDGHFCVGLPWNTENLRSVGSRQVAMKRAEYLNLILDGRSIMSRRFFG